MLCFPILLGKNYFAPGNGGGGGGGGIRGRGAAGGGSAPLICKIFNNTFFYRTAPVAASEFSSYF